MIRMEAFGVPLLAKAYISDYKVTVSLAICSDLEHPVLKHLV
jgi:hypothetical protein